jgi:hypothetical protein
LKQSHGHDQCSKKTTQAQFIVAKRNFAFDTVSFTDWKEAEADIKSDIDFLPEL